MWYWTELSLISVSLIKNQTKDLSFQFPVFFLEQSAACGEGDFILASVAILMDFNFMGYRRYNVVYSLGFSYAVVH